MRFRFTAGLLTATLCAGILAMGAPHASASSKGRKNTLLGLGALAAYELLQGKTGTGLLAGAGAAYAYKRYNDARKDERRYRRYDRYGRYGRYSRTSYRNYDNGYRYTPGGYYESGYQYQNNGDPCPRAGSYTTDEWGNRHYYDPRYSDGYHRYGVGYSEPRYRTAGYRSGYSGNEDCPRGRHYRRYRD